MAFFLPSVVLAAQRHTGGRLVAAKRAIKRDFRRCRRFCLLSDVAAADSSADTVPTRGRNSAVIRSAGSIGDGEAGGDAAYRRLRADIVLGRLRPGQKLGLDLLRRDYGFGVGTLREALNRLA
ncbi:MAG: GntR family transcriptional regulator, partial [Roseomonas sp.]|nr:GntR family transcriptional regulator [Roseomonas sp.]